jgi:hypothetical protein
VRFAVKEGCSSNGIGKNCEIEGRVTEYTLKSERSG